MDKEEIEQFYNKKIRAKENSNKEQVIYSIVSVYTTMNNFEDWLCDDMKDKVANIKQYIEQLENKVKELEIKYTEELNLHYCYEEECKIKDDEIKELKRE